jgi:hypothetical protein
MTTRSVEVPQWWSIPQAIVWIVSHDVAAATDAVSIRFLSEIERLPLPHFFSIGDEPPIASRRAPDLLLSAIRRGTVEVVGRVCGKGKSVRVSLYGMIEPCLKHHDGGLCIVDDSGGWPIHYWSELAMRPNECMRQWPDGRPALPTRGNKPADDDKAIAKVIAAVRATKGEKSPYAAAMDIIDEISGGGSQDSRARRVADKARRAMRME